MISRNATQLLALPLFLISFSMSFSCATPKYNTSVIEPSVATTEPSYKILERAEEIEWEEELAVEVVLRETPEGIHWGTEKNIVIEEGYEDSYTLLGYAMSSREEDGWDAFEKSNAFYVNMHPKHSKFRDLYCKLWMPIRLVTDPFFALVPVQWFCFAWHTGNIEKAIEIHKKELKRVAHAMGGNLILVRDYSTPDSLTGAVLKVNSSASTKPKVSEELDQTSDSVETNAEPVSEATHDQKDSTSISTDNQSEE